MVRKIAVTGPESTGKSMLAESLARVFHTVWVPEFARGYLQELGRPYEERDILVIAQGQIASEEQMSAKADRVLICDTELIVTKIWSDVKYGRCDDWILENLRKPAYELYLLCDIDLPWQADPLREHPHLRQYLFDLYYNELINRKLTFSVVQGQGTDRLRNALAAIEVFFKEKPLI